MRPGSRSMRIGAAMRQGGIVASLSAVVVASASVARADAAAIDRVEPSERGSRFFVTDSLELETPKAFDLVAGVATTYANRLRVFGNQVEGERSSLVENAFAIHPGGAVVLGPGARFALDMPFVFQTGEQTNLSRKAYFAPASPALGDLRASFDLRVFDRPAVRVATGVSAWLPTGSRDDYTSDGYTRFSVRLASTFRAGIFLGAARVSYMYRRELEPFGSVSLGSEANAQLAAGIAYGRFFGGPELHGSTILRDAFEKKVTPIEALLGAHVSVGDFRPGAAVGTSIVSGFGSAHLRAFFSIDWTPGSDAPFDDRDGDGVRDGADVCPDVPGLADAPEATRGCPAAPTDTDHDGVIDDEDACRDLPGPRTSNPKTNGCPDQDRDGVPDPVDACPTISGDGENGCPPDADGDGVPDIEDACMEVPGVRTDDLRTNGCAPAPHPGSTK